MRQAIRTSETIVENQTVNASDLYTAITNQIVTAGTDHGIGSILDQMSVSARSSGSKRILEVVYFAVLFRGRAVTGE